MIRGGHPDEVPLTEEEEKVIAALHRIGKRWPKSLWVYSANGRFSIMRKDADGQPAVQPGVAGSVDPDYEVDSIPGIENDGGDY